jgi:hypothetical protein
VCAQLSDWIGSIGDGADPSARRNADTDILWLWVVMTVDDLSLGAEVMIDAPPSTHSAL